MRIERHKTDLWSVATYNNTIINDNFLDYRLAAPYPTTPQTDISSRSDTPFDFDYDEDPLTMEDNNTLRRNTYSAPDGFTRPINSAPVTGKELAPSRDSWIQASFDAYNRDRSSTFTLGKKYKTDKHVLLKHEEELDGTSSLAQLSVIHDISEDQSDVHVTEL
mgnify:CR=1 FL=1